LAEFFELTIILQDRKIYAELKELHMNGFIDSMIEFHQKSQK